MGATHFQEFGPRFFDMSSASGYMGAKYVQEFGPRFLACHVPNVACHDMFCVVLCQNSASQSVHAMSWPP